ncbi:unnamed protein product [Sphenostylis stenocarpa]|uniref:MYND-type domain-containing protein n=1 Tax=Sphenostylis stenocarpa TaxID=92480 RepID=A0AA87B8P9_9FABA|nr:unnamed protein product [Sphenostylis stenocarpa]
MRVYGVYLSLNCVLMFMVVMILPFLGLLFWLENKLSNDSSEANHLKEHEQINDERNNTLFCERDSANCSCPFCGRLSNTITTCSRCRTAIHCSKACDVKHLKLCHNIECVEIEGSEDQPESPSHGTHCLLMDKYSLNEAEERRYAGDFYHIEGGENSVDELCDETSLICRHGIVNGNEGCAVCGNPSSKVCSRCKAIKYW